ACSSVAVRGLGRRRVRAAGVRVLVRHAAEIEAPGADREILRRGTADREPLADPPPPPHEIDDEGAQALLLDRHLLVEIRIGQHAPLLQKDAREMPGRIETVAREIALHWWLPAIIMSRD